MRAYSLRLPKTADFANFGILTPHGDPVAPGCRGIGGNHVAWGLERICTRGGGGW